MAEGRGVEPPSFPSHHGIRHRLPATQRDPPYMAEDRGTDPQTFRFQPISNRCQPKLICLPYFGRGGGTRTHITLGSEPSDFTNLPTPPWCLTYWILDMVGRTGVEPVQEFHREIYNLRPSPIGEPPLSESINN